MTTSVSTEFVCGICGKYLTGDLRPDIPSLSFYHLEQKKFVIINPEHTSISICCGYLWAFYRRSDTAVYPCAIIEDHKPSFIKFLWSHSSAFSTHHRRQRAPWGKVLRHLLTSIKESNNSSGGASD